jgi:hypothetical protein
VSPNIFPLGLSTKIQLEDKSISDISPTADDDEDVCFGDGYRIVIDIKK